MKKIKVHGIAAVQVCDARGVDSGTIGDKQNKKSGILVMNATLNVLK